MRILIQKFGGTSLSSIEAREHVIRHIKKALSEGYHLIVVVSAMGRKGDPYATDTLIDWAGQNGGLPSLREKDLLLSCGEIISAVTLCGLLLQQNIPAVAFTGAQAGITTNDRFGNAQIISIDTSRMNEQLKAGKVVIVTGFQGQTYNGDITTLGRGGSDTSATAIGAAIKAEMVHIFTDVNGILTADPRIVKDAKPLSSVTYTEICNMAHNGAKVIHPRAVEIAMQSNIPLRIRSTFFEEEGTLVTSQHLMENRKKIKDNFITGIAYVSKVSQIQVIAENGQLDLQLKVFKAMAQHQISVDFINVNPLGVVYTVFSYEAERALHILRNLSLQPNCLNHCAKVSVIGGGMNGVPGIMAQIVEALTDKDIPILQSADSNTTIWVLVKEEDMEKAVQSLHHKFNLHK
jgi:aspartate kinase